MKKILDNKDLFEQFKNDREVMSQKQLAEKYSISLSTVQRLAKNQNLLKLVLNNHKIILKNNHKIILKNNHKIILKNKKILKIQKQPMNKQMDNLKFLFKKVWNKKYYLKSLLKKISKKNKLLTNPLLIIQTNLMTHQKFKETKKKNSLLLNLKLFNNQQQFNNQFNKQIFDKTLKMKMKSKITWLKFEESIFHIIGSTEFKQRQFISRLYLKNLEELKLIPKTIEFELLFSRSNTFVQDSIESGALFIERLLLTIDVNVVGVYQELQEDQEFQFYMNMYLCESSYVASAKQILFLKFIQNYYKKFSENKGNTSIDQKQKLKEQANKQLLERFNKL